LSKLNDIENKNNRNIEIIKKLIKELSKILENDDNYCGSIIINFYMGGVTGITKKENIKLK